MHMSLRRRKKVKRAADPGASSSAYRGRGLRYGPLQDLLGFHLRRAQLKTFQDFRRDMKAHGVTPGQVGLLILISENPGMSQSNLARAVEVERATLGETIRELAQRGWVDQRPSEEDGRIKTLYLSAKGKAALRRIIPVLQKHDREAGGNLSDAEFSQLLSLARKYAEGAR
jgi:DNA-binding MarR family transcriptional regulator